MFRAGASALILAASPAAQAQISGTVFRDLDRDGVLDATAPIEPGIPNVTVNAYGANDALLGTQTTAANGNYSFSAIAIPATTAVRLEFVVSTNCFTDATTDYASAYSSAAGGNKGSVLFVTAGASANAANYGLVNLDEYYTTGNPRFGVPNFISGNPTGGGTAGTYNAFSVMSYTDIQSTNGVLLNSAKRQASAIGAVWGLAYSRQARRFFAAACVRRHVGLGPLGASGIYVIDTTQASNATSTFVDLATLGFPAAATSGTYPYPANGTIDTARASSGIIPFSDVVGTNFQRGLRSDVSVYTGGATNLQPYASYDAAAFEQAGKLGLGGLEISADGRYLFVVNLYDKKVYRIDLQNAASPVVPTAAQVTSYTIPTPTGVPAADMRPWGLKFYRGRLYVGIVNSAQSTAARSDLEAYVYQLDPTGTGTWTQTYALTDMTFLRGATNATQVTNGPATSGSNDVDSVTHWNAWTNNYDLLIRDVVSGNRQLSMPQPMLADIEFDDYGGMILGFADRTGLQVGYRNYSPYNVGNDGATPGNQRASADGGDLMYVGLSTTTSCTRQTETAGAITNSGGPVISGGAANLQGVGGGEFYYQDFYSTAHLETAFGALLEVPGTREVMVTALDAASVGGVNTGGVRRFSNITGAAITDGTNSGSNVYDQTTRGVTNAKGGGLGDIEVVGVLPPTEIGNRVWADANGNGIQDPSEAGLASVSLQLYADFNGDGSPDGSVLGTATTDASGYWVFNSANVVDGDPATAGNQAGLKASSTYLVRINTTMWSTTTGTGTGTLANYRLTRTSAVGNGRAGWSDNDAALVGSIPQISVTTGAEGANRDDLDFGVTALARLGDRVWRDDDKDGIQDAGEPGVAGVMVELFNASNQRAGSVITDALGNYFFDNLTAATYTVRVTPPANYTLSPTGAGTASTDNNFSLTATNGYSTGNITIAAGELNASVDAGLVFNTPAAQASVGDLVFLDLNTNNIKDATDPGLAGVTVMLLDGTTNAILAATETDATGAYLFTNVAAGSYKIRVTPPAGTSVVTKSASPLTTNGDSDIDPTTFTSDAFTVAAGTAVVNVDAGLRRLPNTQTAVGDFVWYDVDADGIQDAGEPGIPGATVELLFDSNGDGFLGGTEATTATATTTTDAYGKYVFTALTPGVYGVRFLTPSGYTFTTRDAGQSSGSIDSTNDSDPNITTGVVPAFNAQAGVYRTNIDAGFRIANTSTLGDFVWNDLNGDGLQTAGEPGVAGVTATLYTSGGTLQARTYTDRSGAYRFTGLALGTYYVVFSNLPANYSFTTQTTGTATGSDADAQGRTANVSVAANTNATDVDAGLRQGVPAGTGSIGDCVFADLDADGIQDAGELGVADVSVRLFKSTGTQIGNAVFTDARGRYLFTDLDTGTYYVVFSNILGTYTASTAGAGTDRSLDSDPGTLAGTGSTATYTTGNFVLGRGEDLTSVDLGIVRTGTATLGDLVWLDADADGIQDAGEPGIPGVQVTLLDGAGAVVNVNGRPYVTATNADGLYQFSGLPYATYSVAFGNVPDGYYFTTQTTSTATGSDPNRATGRTGNVTLNAGSPNNADLDAGLATTTRAAIGNFVWNDLNGDGLQTAGEPGIPGVAVKLTFDANGDGNISTAERNANYSSAVTNAAGRYLFSNLPAGRYEVEFLTTGLPTGLAFTTQTTGTANGSDADVSTGRAASGLLAASAVNLDIDAGVRNSSLAQVGDRAFFDFNNNGLQNAGEVGVPGMLATLAQGATTIGAAITDGSGLYLFNGVTPGSNYTLTFSGSHIPSFTLATTGSNPRFSTQNAGGGAAANESRVAQTTGAVAAFTVARGNRLLDFDAGVINITAAVPLPVDLLSFDAALVGGRTRLDWRVAREVGIARYEVEWSTTGTGFSRVDAVTANGGTAYTGWHATPAPGTNYYRLKVVSADGTAEWSAVRTVVVSAAGSVSIYPNPATAGITVDATAAVGTVTLYNAAGAVVGTRSGAGTLSTTHLAAGTYLLVVQTPDGAMMTQQRVVVQR